MTIHHHYTYHHSPYGHTTSYTTTYTPDIQVGPPLSEEDKKRFMHYWFGTAGIVTIAWGIFFVSKGISTYEYLKKYCPIPCDNFNENCDTSCGFMDGSPSCAGPACQTPDPLQIPSITIAVGATLAALPIICGIGMLLYNKLPRWGYSLWRDTLLPVAATPISVPSLPIADTPKVIDENTAFASVAKTGTEK